MIHIRVVFQGNPIALHCILQYCPILMHLVWFNSPASEPSKNYVTALKGAH